MTEEQDPRARWRELPERVRPEDYVEEADVPGHDSSLAADEQAEQREVTWLIERGGFLGG